MGELSKRFPDDLDVATLYAESLMNLRPGRSTRRTHAGTGDRVDRRCARARDAAQSESSGRHHYYIHAVEASKRPERATGRSSRRLETLVPGAGHLVHMPPTSISGPVSMRNRQRVTPTPRLLTRKYFKAANAGGPFYGRYYGHNLQFESAARCLRHLARHAPPRSARWRSRIRLPIRC